MKQPVYLTDVISLEQWGDLRVELIPNYTTASTVCATMLSIKLQHLQWRRVALDKSTI